MNATNSSLAWCQAVGCERKANPSLNDLKFGVPNPDAVKAFNSTVNITLDSTSPMIQMDQYGESWTFDLDTGYREYVMDPETPDMSGPSLPFVFVGTGFSLQGVARQHPGTGSADVTAPPATVRLRTILPAEDPLGKIKPLRSVQVNGTEGLGALSNLDLSTYFPVVELEATTDAVFFNATFEIPIRTQAPSFEHLWTQSRYFDVVQGSNPTSDFSFEPCSISEELLLIGEIANGQVVPNDTFAATGPPAHRIIDNYLLIGNATEAVYKVPQNTTLIEVFGPVGDDNEWQGRSTCYATFDPKPSWWNGLVPTSLSVKNFRRSNRTMFILPIDPTIDFTLRIGAPQNVTCPISGIRTDYSFLNSTATDRNATAEVRNDTNPPTDVDGATDTGTGTKKGRTSHTSVVVGVVVGVVCGLLFLGLALWSWCRHHSKRHDLSKHLQSEPYTHKTDAVTSTEDSGNIDSDSSPSPSPEDDPATEDMSPVRGLEEDNGSEIVEFLPPQYFSAWRDEAPSHRLAREVNGSGSDPADSNGTSGEPALKQEYRQLPPRPELKQDYDRAFSRRPLPTPAGPRPLEASYRRAFGVGSEDATAAERLKQASSSGQQSSSGHLQNDYKRAFDYQPAGGRSAAAKE